MNCRPLPLLLLMLVILLPSCSTLIPSGGTPKALDKKKFPSSSTVIFGKIIDLNSNSIKSKLQLTYVLSNKEHSSLLDSDTNFPNIDPESGYFWIAISNEKVKYFGIRSIRFVINGVEASAVIRDDKNHRPLFGMPINKKAKFIYVGDITIRTGLRKTAAGLNAEVFDIKEAYNKNNPATAKNFLEEKGIDSKDLVVHPLNLRKI